MSLIVTMMTSVCLIFGSLAGAILLCILLWRVLERFHHPELGALVIGILIAVALIAPITHSLFVRMVLLFTMAGAVPFWIAGREWRAAYREKTTRHDRR